MILTLQPTLRATFVMTKRCSDVNMVSDKDGELFSDSFLINIIKFQALPNVREIDINRVFSMLSDQMIKISKQHLLSAQWTI